MINFGIYCLSLFKICSCSLWSPLISPSHLFLVPDICLYLTIVCSLVVGSPPHLHPLRNKHHFYQIKLSLESFQSAFTRGPMHEPSPSEGRGKTHGTNLAPNVRPMVCGHSSTCIQQPGFHPNPALALPSVDGYRASAQHPT